MRSAMCTIGSIIAAIRCFGRRVAITVGTALMTWRPARRRGGGKPRYDSSPGWPVNVFDYGALDGATDVRIRVECIPTARDEDHPIRLVLLDANDVTLTELKFTPFRARETAYPIARLLGEFIPRIDSTKIAEGLRLAAIKVWAQRN